MTIQDYLSDLKKVQLKSGEDFSAEMAQIAEVWSNAACKGYAIKAMQNAGLDDETIRKVRKELSYCFEEISVDEAAAIFENS